MARPARNHYVPDLHQLRLELEEAATPEGHAVRFGFNPLEFESFSWRGYAQMTPIQVSGTARSQGSTWSGWCGGQSGVGKLLRSQARAGSGQGGEILTVCAVPSQPRIVARLNVTSPDLFRLVFRYVNRGPTSVSGRVSVREEGKFATCTNCEYGGPAPPSPYIHSTAIPPNPSPALGPCVVGEAWLVLSCWAPWSTAWGDPWAVSESHPPLHPPGTEQSQPVAFPPSIEPAFVTVPQRGFGEPFVLNPGTWALLVEAEGVLLVRPAERGGRG